VARKRQRGNGQGTLFQRDGGGPWIVKYFDANGRRRERSTKTTDKTRAQRFMAKWTMDAFTRRAGVIDARAEALAVQARRPIGEHLADFKTALLAKGSTPGHVAIVCARARKVMHGAGFRTWAEVSASRAMEYLKGLRADRETRNEAGEVVKRRAGISSQTFNFYLGAAKQLARWMVKDRRAADNPLAHLEGLNVRLDRRRDRRALTADDLRELIRATEAGPERYGMTGPERAFMYRLAVETGLRAAEARSLTRASFELGTKPPTVTVLAAYSKRRRDDVLMLRPALAELAGEHLKTKAPAAAVFNAPADRRLFALMFKADRDAAGIPARDAGGRVCDFHGLRHTFISNLAAGGVHPKVAQALARHSTITLTMDRYTHQLVGDELAALDVLPDLAQQAKATGTDGKAVTADSSPTSRHAKPQQADASRCDEAGDNSQAGDVLQEAQNTNEHAGLRDVMQPAANSHRNGEGGIRTPGTIARTLVFETSPNPSKSPVNTAFSESPPTVDPPVGGQNSPADPELMRVAAAWPELPAAIRAGIVAMVAAIPAGG